jgi:hypothetical protein
VLRATVLLACDRAAWVLLLRPWVLLLRPWVLRATVVYVRP